MVGVEYASNESLYKPQYLFQLTPAGMTIYRSISATDKDKGINSDIYFGIVPSQGPDGVSCFLYFFELASCCSEYIPVWCWLIYMAWFGICWTGWAEWEVWDFPTKGRCR